MKKLKLLIFGLVLSGLLFMPISTTLVVQAQGTQEGGDKRACRPMCRPFEPPPTLNGNLSNSNWATIILTQLLTQLLIKP